MGGENLLKNVFYIYYVTFLILSGKIEMYKHVKPYNQKVGYYVKILLLYFYERKITVCNLIS